MYAVEHSDGLVRAELKLPVLVFGVVEVRRLRRELEAVDDFMRQAAIREPGKPAALPRVSRLLDALVLDNGRNLLQETDRQELAAYLDTVAKTAPTIHISFASDPSSAFTAKLVTWLRGNIHPSVLLQIGLQPTIAAGCVVRTASKNFDFSLRHKLEEQRGELLKALNASNVAPAVAAPVPTEAQA
jgi:F0F1-type ATP synthase delta subunit